MQLTSVRYFPSDTSEKTEYGLFDVARSIVSNETEIDKAIAMIVLI